MERLSTMTNELHTKMTNLLSGRVNVAEPSGGKKSGRIFNLKPLVRGGLFRVLTRVDTVNFARLTVDGVNAKYCLILRCDLF